MKKTKNNKRYVPKPVFDTLEAVITHYKAIYADSHPNQQIKKWLTHCLKDIINPLPTYLVKDYQFALAFLYSYRGSQDTFDAYRRDIERFLQWSWFVRGQSVLKHQREDIESFIKFCIAPYKGWIGLKNVARFKHKNSEKIPNPAWRPFTVHINKKDRKADLVPDKNVYQLSQQALKVMFGILSSFYNFLLQEEVAKINPVLLIRQKSKFILKNEGSPSIRRLSEQQWQTVFQLAKKQAENDVKHERTVFILSCLYSMYLRISELVASERWQPTMGDFFKDLDGNWWFRTIGKGNKKRQIAVSDTMLEALKHYRKTYLKLTPIPLPNEKTPLIGHANNPNAPMTSTRPIRQLIQTCFDQAADSIESCGDKQEAELLRTATVHWLRHTGISEDVKHRPREHVRDDAGHSSSSITDRYINIELKERAKSAKKKLIITENPQNMD